MSSADETLLSTTQQESRQERTCRVRPHPPWRISKNCARFAQQSLGSEPAIHRYERLEVFPQERFVGHLRAPRAELMNPRFRTNSTRRRSTQSRRERPTSLGAKVESIPMPDGAPLVSVGSPQPCETNQPSISLSGTSWRDLNARRSVSAAGNNRRSPT